MGALKKMSSLSVKGQTTVPREIREKLDLHAGDQLIFEIKSDGEVVLKKAISPKVMDYLRSVEKTLSAEWAGNDDDDL